MKRVLILVLLIGACSVPPVIEIPSEEQLNEKVATLADNLIEPSREQLGVLLHEKLTYGHSTGVIETKTEFIDALYANTDILSWAMSEMENEIVGNTAWVRHNLAADLVSDGDSSSISLKVMMVWVYENNNWKLLARQAVK